jgi:hypothetical protein
MGKKEKIFKTMRGKNVEKFYTWCRDILQLFIQTFEFWVKFSET